MIGKAIGFAPMVSLFVGYLIIPLVFIGMIIGYFVYPLAVVIACLVSIITMWILT